MMNAEYGNITLSQFLGIDLSKVPARHHPVQVYEAPEDTGMKFKYHVIFYSLFESTHHVIQFLHTHGVTEIKLTTGFGYCYCDVMLTAREALWLSNKNVTVSLEKQFRSNLWHLARYEAYMHFEPDEISQVVRTRKKYVWPSKYGRNS